MKKAKLPRPTDTEILILRVLWQRGPSTVRQVFEEIGRTQASGYTTILKLMQIMVEKGLLKRDDTDRSHVYEASVAEEETQRQLVGHLLERAFSGSTHKLVLRALSGQKATREELAEIRRLLDDLERKST
jgi:predicted transcriptional regulator